MSPSRFQRVNFVVDVIKFELQFQRTDFTIEIIRFEI